MGVNLRSLRKIIDRFKFINFTSKICSDKGSLSVEALITLPVFLTVTVIFCICIKSMFIYEMMDQCFANVSENVAHSIIYSQLAHSEGIAENIARIAIVDYDLQQEIDDLDSMWASNVDQKNGFEIIEESFDDDAGVGVYSLNYKINLLANKKIVCEHRQRIRSVWQYENENLLAGNDEENEKQQTVYTSEHGRRKKIYHTDAHCFTLNRSYKKQGSVQIAKVLDLDGYVECKVCQQERMGK